MGSLNPRSAQDDPLTGWLTHPCAGGVPSHGDSEQSAQRLGPRKASPGAHRVLMVRRGHPGHFLTWFHLSRAGLTVLSAEGGDDAADLLQIIARRAGTPSLIVIDARIQPEEAIAAAEAVRARRYRGPMLGLVPDQFTRALHARLSTVCDSYTTTPVEPERLLDLCATMAEWGQVGNMSSDAGDATR